MTTTTAATATTTTLSLTLFLLAFVQLLLLTPTLATLAPEKTCSNWDVIYNYTMGCTTIIGDLEVANTYYINLDLFNSVKIIKGSLIINIYDSDSSGLSESFSDLREVGGFLKFYREASDSDFRIPTLQRVNGTFMIHANGGPGTVNCDDFPNLSYIGGLDLDVSNTGCTSANPLPLLTEIPGDVSIQNPFLDSSNIFSLLSNVVSIHGDLLILDDDPMTSYNFTKLHTVKGSLKFHASAFLLNYFSNLTEVKTLDIMSSTALAISFPKLETVTGTFRLAKCYDLISVSFPKLTRVATIKNHDNPPGFIIQETALNITQQFKNITVVNGDAQFFYNLNSCLRHNSQIVTIASGKFLFFENKNEACSKLMIYIKKKLELSFFFFSLFY